MPDARSDLSAEPPFTSWPPDGLPALWDELVAVLGGTAGRTLLSAALARGGVLTNTSPRVAESQRYTRSVELLGHIAEAGRATHLPARLEKLEGLDITGRSEAAAMLARALYVHCHAPRLILADSDLRRLVEAVAVSPAAVVALEDLRHELLGGPDPLPSSTATSAPSAVAGAPGGQFDELRAMAAKLRLKGNEAVAVVAVCDGGGRVPLKDLAALFSWNNPVDNWNSTRQRLNVRFKGSGWRFATHDKQAVAEHHPPTGRK